MKLNFEAFISLGNFFLKGFVLLCLSAHSMGDEAKPIEDSEKITHLDMPLTIDNSVLVNFIGGGALRMPDFMIDQSIIPSDRHQGTIPVNFIGTSFTYPDMTLTDWKSESEVYTEQSEKKYIPTPDRFPVHITWLFYSPGEIGNQERLQLRDPRPPRIVHNLHDCYALAKHCVKMVSRNSQLPDMDSIISGDWLQTHPEDLVHKPAEGGDYVAKADVPYEAYMSCGGFTGVQCKAYVFIKKNNFQYRMQFPPEAVNHADDLIRKFNSIVNQWVDYLILN